MRRIKHKRRRKSSFLFKFLLLFLGLSSLFVIAIGFVSSFPDVAGISTNNFSKTIYLKDHLAKESNPHQALQNAIDEAIASGRQVIDMQNEVVPISKQHSHAGLTWGLSAAGNICLTNGTITNSLNGVTTIMYFGLDKTEKLDSWAAYRHGDKPVFPILNVKKGQEYIDLAIANDAKNFKAGDKIYLRTGQLIYSDLNHEPQAELFKISFISGKRLHLNTATRHSYSQEYFPDESKYGYTSTKTSSWPAPFGVANVTDITSDNFCLKNMKIENKNTNTPIVLGGGTMSLTFSNNTFIADQSVMSMGIYSQGLINNNKIIHTGTNADAWAYAFTGATGTSYVQIIGNTIESEKGSLFIHIHEGSNAYIYNNKILSGNRENITYQPVSVRARGTAVIKNNIIDYRSIGGLAMYADESTSGQLSNNTFKVSFSHKPYYFNGTGWKENGNVILKQ